MSAPIIPLTNVIQPAGTVSFSGMVREPTIITVQSGATYYVSAAAGIIIVDNKNNIQSARINVVAPFYKVPGGLSKVLVKCKYPDHGPVNVSFLKAAFDFSQGSFQATATICGPGAGTKPYVVMGFYHDEGVWRHLEGSPLMALYSAGSAVRPTQLSGKMAHFGAATAVSNSGNIIAVAAPNYNIDQNTFGAVLVYRYNSAVYNYVLEATLSQSGIGSSGFGSCLSFNVDENMLAIGAPQYSYNTDSNKGAVFMYHYVAGQGWTCDLTASPSSGVYNGLVQAPYLITHDSHFGYNCAFSPCDDKFVVAANGLNNNGTDAQPQYGGIAWFTVNSQTFQTTFKDTFAIPDNYFDKFASTCDLGISLAFSPDATRIVVTNDVWQHNNGLAGAAYVYKYNFLNGAWEYDSSIALPDSWVFVRNFGTSAAIGLDPNMVVIGGDNSSNSLITHDGAVFTFTRDASGGSWVMQPNPLRIPSNVAQFASGFGNKIITSRDMSRMFVIAPLPGTNQSSGVGRCFSFYRCEGTWTLANTYSPNFGTYTSNLGGNIACSGDMRPVILGLPGFANQDGAFSVFC